ncbi:hypothetical protein SMACR_02763 [Sordaria macrospora]|uniref:WGS project CABT00000000 data, contig 2.11 n=2 Tax=Sordaria macrospora TaxID=5147 RepID=F7VXE3_SORMK|nr:uncharacterized protein SMAC_02763 [Sordaria macrospora k-hell]KAA8627959.1 hypothetical protein SMACR_02763 [Sordaria macrospora]WPJ60404.1 hypothetical protein SMAC4_02763 [Sordaria macrospora]CCC10185.1 unnamed protein product [Sordaria macrospora k-hell]
MAGGLMNSIHAPKAHQPPPSSSQPQSHHSHDEGDSFHDGPGPKSKRNRPPRKKQLMKYIPKPDPEPQQQSPPAAAAAAAASAPVKPPSPPRKTSPKRQTQAQAQPKPPVTVAPNPPPPITTTTSIPIRTNTSPIAKSPTTPKSPVRVSPSAKHELIRYTKIVRRLKWKLPFLASGYALALKGRDPKHGDAVISGVVLNEGEIMFKLDFFEYYMLIERALVHLLGVFGITVSGDGIRGKGLAGSRFSGQGCQAGGGGGGGRESKGGSRGGSPKEGSPNRAVAAGEAASGNGGKFQHRYHAHVLEAFDSPVHPLHDILGKGEVRKQLQRAKDLRNRWKTADSEAEEDERRKLTAPLESYDVEKMLETIFQGFDAAFLIAEWHVRDKEGGLEKGAQSKSLNWADDDDEDGDATMMDWAAQEADQWEFMVDAMDWEAV